MNVSPALKKTLSGVAVGIASAVLAELAHDAPQIVAFLPTWAQALAASAAIGLVTGAAHIVDAWGHQDRVAQLVANAQAGNPPNVPDVPPKP